jgi:hypothetical protein
MRLLTLPAVLLLALPAVVHAQDEIIADTTETSNARRPFTVTPYLGYQGYDNQSALKGGGVFALDITYRLRSWLGLGVTGSASRPVTDGSYFPLVRLGGDSSRYYRISQRVTEYNIGVHGVVSRPMGALAPYVSGSAGFYQFEMNPQAVGTTRRFSGPMTSIGAGAKWQIGSRTGIAVEIRDVIYGNFDRSKLDASDPLFRDLRYDPIPAGKPEPWSLLNNIRMAVGVSFLPAPKGGPR